MGRKKISSATALLLVVVCALGGTLGVIGYMAWQNSVDTQSSQSLTTFSVVAYDYNANATLPLSNFDYTLQGLPVGESSIDVLAWETIESASTLESLTTGDLDTTLYSAFNLIYNGSVAQTATCFDDAFGTRTYPRREQAILPGQRNVLECVAAPATVVLEIRNLITLVANTNVTATPIAGQTNVTFVTMLSATYANNAYEDFWSFVANANVAPTITLTYNGTVTSSTALQISGWTGTRVSTTSMVYTCAKLFGIQSHVARWGASAPVTLGVTAAAVSFDGTSLATNP